MCLIVDANVVHKVFDANGPATHRPVWNALFGKNAFARFVIGGRLLREYVKGGLSLARIQEWQRAGVAIVRREVEVDAEEAEVKKIGMCRSNDQHVIALARLAGVRLLCTDESGRKPNSVVRDWKNRKIMSPAGCIYRDKSHAALLRKCCGKKCCCRV